MKLELTLIRYNFLIAVATVFLSACINNSAEKSSSPQVTASLPDTIAKETKKSKTAALTVNIVTVKDARAAASLDQILPGVNNIYQQCRIEVDFNIQARELSVDGTIDETTRIALAEQYKGSSPTMFLVPMTAEVDVAFAYRPTHFTATASTIWITDRVRERCLPWIAAHELGHVLLNSGKHSNGSRNVMSNSCTINNWSNHTPIWTNAQCEALHQSQFLVSNPAKRNAN